MGTYRIAISVDGKDYQFRTGEDFHQQYLAGDDVDGITDLITDGVGMENVSVDGSIKHRFFFGLVVIQGGRMRGVVDLPGVGQWPPKETDIGWVLAEAKRLRELWRIDEKDVDMFERHSRRRA